MIVGVPDTNLKEHETNQHITCKLTHYFYAIANLKFWMRSYDKVDLVHSLIAHLGVQVGFTPSSPIVGLFLCP
jgi:hypothetical protein